MADGQKGVFIICSQETKAKLDDIAPSQAEKELFLKISVNAYSSIYKQIDRRKAGFVTALAGKIYAHFLHKKGNDL